MNALGLADLREATAEHLVTLRVLYKDVTGGEKTVEEVFGTSMDAEINMLMGELGYNEAKKTHTMREYKGRREELLKFLQTQVEADRRAGVKPSNGQPANTATTQSVPETAGTVAQTQTEPEKTVSAGASGHSQQAETLGSLKAVTEQAKNGNGKKRFF